ncbi:hypothetical protein [Arthrobacter antioxidans]|uniref:hypothetical protein n=1 Tax=Arthrobacter antioxidans TaxID=2895818 RepID=UPI0020000A90|nr:hypothetical protein [Arthrobacter antioxidans]
MNDDATRGTTIGTVAIAEAPDGVDHPTPGRVLEGLPAPDRVAAPEPSRAD